MIKMSDLQSNKHYRKYYKEKQKIKDKYPPNIFLSEGRGGKRFYEEGEQELYQKYLKELSNVIFQPNGDFQKFSWDALNDVEKLQMERTARGKYTPQTYY